MFLWGNVKRSSISHDFCCYKPSLASPQWSTHLNASLHKFPCLNASFFSRNDEVTREQRQQLTQAEECGILLWDTSWFIQISRTTNLFEHISTKHIINNVMINHLAVFLHKCVLAFKRDNHHETSPSVKQKTLQTLALVFSVSRTTSFSVIILTEIWFVQYLSWVTLGYHCAIHE